MLMKLIYMFLFEARVAVIHVAEPPLRRVTSFGDHNFFNLLHYKVSYNRADRGAHHTSKDLFLVYIIMFEVVLLKNKF